MINNKHNKAIAMNALSAENKSRNALVGHGLVNSDFIFSHLMPVGAGIAPLLFVSGLGMLGRAAAARSAYGLSLRSDRQWKQRCAPAFGLRSASSGERGYRSLPQAPSSEPEKRAESQAKAAGSAGYLSLDTP